MPESAADRGGPARPTPAELGQRIAELRVAAGLGLDQVAAGTRIRVGLLRSIEAGDFAPCGGAVYARGHLRSIAAVVHADGGALVAAYDRMAGDEPASTPIHEEPHEPAAHVPFAEVSGPPPGGPPELVDRPGRDVPPPRGPRPLPTPVSVTGSLDPAPGLQGRDGTPRIVMPGQHLRDRRTSPGLLVGIGIAAVLVVVAAIALVSPSKSGKSTTATTGPSPSVSAPVSSGPPTSSTPAPPTSTAPAASGVNVTVSVVGQASWVKAANAKGTVFQGVIDAGGSKQFHDDAQLSFTFGYAPAVHLTYNGQSVATPPPTRGYVASATFAAGSSTPSA